MIFFTNEYHMVVFAVLVMRGGPVSEYLRAYRLGLLEASAGSCFFKKNVKDSSDLQMSSLRDHCVSDTEGFVKRRGAPCQNVCVSFLSTCRDWIHLACSGARAGASGKGLEKHLKYNQV